MIPSHYRCCHWADCMSRKEHAFIKSIINMFTLEQFLYANISIRYYPLLTQYLSTPILSALI